MTKFQKGERFRPSATQFNRYEVAADFAERARQSGDNLAAAGTSPTVVLAVNDLETRLSEAAIVSMDSPYFVQTASDAKRESFREGTTVRAGIINGTIYRSRFGVLVDGAASHDAAAAIVSGVAVAKVNVTSTHHRFARPTTNDNTQLTSDWWGGAELLVRPTVTGAQWCYVRLGTVQPHTYEVKITATHAKGTAQACRVWIGGTDTGADIANVVNRYGTITASVGSPRWAGVTLFGGPDGYPGLIAREC